ncbi:MAG: PorT family protein [Chitinophagaceae bacterium]|nr:PorT family protein [Chitinophagaceae bacterium]MBK7557006.1 PorT family protein [Chitinophagaceae bacterium]MBK9532408.1 PorT family protein [Chitinophagaceae bacterium]HQW92815.1 porin family protein [Ferruginibacter sp.]
MKTKLLILAIFSFFSTATFAQKLQVGIKGGANINKITGKSFSDEFSYGYHLGGMLAIGLGKKFAIQPEILFNQINVDTSSSFSTVYKFNQVDKVQLKYLSIPILLNYKPVKFLTLQAGPQFGVLMNKSNTLLENGRDAFKAGDLSMLGGAQINIGHLKIYGRYAVGLSNLNDIDNQEKWKSQGFQLGVGLTL